jgi:hypothetical protein
MHKYLEITEILPFNKAEVTLIKRHRAYVHRKIIYIYYSQETILYLDYILCDKLSISRRKKEVQSQLRKLAGTTYTNCNINDFHLEFCPDDGLTTTL